MTLWLAFFFGVATPFIVWGLVDIAYSTYCGWRNQRDELTWDGLPRRGVSIQETDA